MCVCVCVCVCVWKETPNFQRCEREVLPEEVVKSDTVVEPQSSLGEAPKKHANRAKH